MKLWYPYKQMRDLGQVPVMVAGNGTQMILEDGRILIDGISSWWAVIHGYNHPDINHALIDQINHFSHVMLGGLSHPPALALADKLVAVAPAGLNHVFYSDSGSVGVEVALKMALQYWKNTGHTGKHSIISLKNGYHGDTFKAMEVGDDSDFSSAFADVLHRGFFLDTPAGGFHADTATLQKDIDALEGLLKAHATEIACFILEPIVQCAGGFRIYSPLYLKAARELCDQYDVLLVFDEVATGFGRTGKLFAAEHAGITPDIMIIGKALTAGYMGHAATLATTRIFNSFLGESYEKALMHGPTFMGNPLATTVALKSIEIIERDHYLDRIAAINALIQTEFDKISSPAIADKRIVGAIGAIELKDDSMMAGFRDFAIANNAWLRPIGKVMYVMPAYIITDEELLFLIGVMKEWISRIYVNG
ncbi:adenosylmethionine--8-amino-7-oxononanoate transaminase [Chitinophaga sancti]|uniref:Adenosylmethionine-8-amino-7-oxononanoate aminotransferase n=1 Tax=Chitinophaga sancti TaxID=1004 RepID=A0A1K1S509_9BACT|nr:adenosylmethionine--8-amino-7-oxononanoate transaminase [Chitinophaga sancti]WQD63745.1 adenosylmethionine--8-amino-7-oxononanoate transaminase [Chitinophaga sancti]WQG90630.1 adenosylmethionine--8-amino-7-oxononanoate transaminase [Chitinophaga sancti]SFW79109.1 adenosylmethionine-8-amino-7-oxononanoate aminotransferase [Chitinophaga sancti]